MKTISVICSFYCLVTSFTVIASAECSCRGRSNSAPQLSCKIERSAVAPSDDEQHNETSAVPSLDESEYFQQRIRHLLFVQEVLAGQYLPSTPPPNDVRISHLSEESSDDNTDYESEESSDNNNEILRTLYRATLNLPPIPRDEWEGPDFILLETTLVISISSGVLSADALLACISSIPNLEKLVIKVESDDGSLPKIIKLLSDLKAFQEFISRHSAKIEQLKKSLEWVSISIAHETLRQRSQTLYPDVLRNLIPFMEIYGEIKYSESDVKYNPLGYKMDFGFKF